MHQGDALREFLKNLPNETMGGIAKILDMSRQNLNHHLRKEVLDEDFRRLIKDKMGVIYSENTFSIIDTNSNEILTVLKTDDSGKKKGFPVFDAVATGGPSENISQLTGQPLFYMNIPGYEDCSMGIYHYGHSMYPTIESGNLLALKPVYDKTIIMYGEIYLLHTRDYYMVKRLQRNDKRGHVLCTSDNYEQRSPEFKRFEPFDLPIDKVIDLFLVKGIFKKTQS